MHSKEVSCCPSGECPQPSYKVRHEYFVILCALIMLKISTPGVLKPYFTTNNCMLGCLASLNGHSLMLTHHRLLEAERKKKKKFHGSSALKERLKYYDLILKRLQGFINEGHHTAPGSGSKGKTSSYSASYYDDDDGAV